MSSNDGTDHRPKSLRAPCPRLAMLAPLPLTDFAMPAHGVMFHHFHGPGHPRVQGSIDAAKLVELLERLKGEGLIDAREWLERARFGRLRPSDVCLTFDDALKCQGEIAAPVLAEAGLAAMWFVYTSVMAGGLERLEIYRMFRARAFPSVDNFYAAFEARLESGPSAKLLADGLARFDPRTYLGEFPFYTEADRRFRFVRDEILGRERYEETMDAMIRDAGHTLEGLARNIWLSDRDLASLAADGHIIGLHSHTHPTRLETLPEAEQRHEYARNRDHLTGVLGRPPIVVAHPSNSYSGLTLGILRDLGIEVGFRASMAEVGGGPLEYPRDDHTLVLRRLGLS
jgi:peptidoglycan/xylan/chitin deacetylase (PgdA/CDA1 family)